LTVRDTLNDIAASGNDEFAGALKDASENIKLLDKLNINIFGRDPRRVSFTEDKINTLINALGDPNKKRAVIDLLSEIDPSGGLLNKMQVIADSKGLTQGFAGISSPLITGQQILTKTSAAVGRGVGSARQRVPGIRNRILDSVEGAKDKVQQGGILNRFINQ
jgi:hypothetical protein